MTVLIHAHSSDILDMKSLVKFAQQVGPFDSNKETKFFFTLFHLFWHQRMRGTLHMVSEQKG